MKQIVVFPRGQLSDKDRKALSRAGVLIVEADDPSKVVSVLPSVGVAGDEMLAMALEAMQAVNFSEPIFKGFVVKLAQAVRRRVQPEEGKR